MHEFDFIQSRNNPWLQIDNRDDHVERDSFFEDSLLSPTRSNHFRFPYFLSKHRERDLAAFQRFFFILSVSRYIYEYKKILTRKSIIIYSFKKIKVIHLPFGQARLNSNRGKLKCCLRSSNFELRSAKSIYYAVLIIETKRNRI